MTRVIFEGVGLGLLIAVLVGPVFFALLQLSIERGGRHAIFMALGIVCSDSLYIAMSYLGIIQLTGNKLMECLLGWAGGILLIVTGIVLFFKKPVIRITKASAPDYRDKIRYFMKGFMLNLINPSVLIFWFSMVGVMMVEFQSDQPSVIAFFGSTIGTIFCTDLLKIYVSGRLSQLITPLFLSRLNKVSGLLVVVFGMKLLADAILLSSP